MSHVDTADERPSWWRRATHWLTDSYDEAFQITTATVVCGECDWQATHQDRSILIDQLDAHTAQAHPVPDLADDLPHVADAVRREPEVRRRASTTQQRMVEAVLTELDEHGLWLHEHPNTPQRERVERARRVVFRAVQAGISVVRPVAERDARRAALAEAADYVAQQRSVIEAAEGLRRHLGEGTLPMRPERYPVAVHAARTTGPMAVVPERGFITPEQASERAMAPLPTPPHLVGLPTAVVDGEHREVVDL